MEMKHHPFSNNSEQEIYQTADFAIGVAGHGAPFDSRPSFSVWGDKLINLAQPTSLCPCRPAGVRDNDRMTTTCYKRRRG
jgi:hypothetical protein